MQTEGKISKHDPPSHYFNCDGLELDYEGNHVTLKWNHVGQREMATKLVSILTSFALRVLFKEHLLRWGYTRFLVKF